MTRRLWLLALLAVGCGPFDYVTVVTFEADKAVQEAKAANAAELAPYEYTSAVEYLHKARELGGHARYHEAIELGEKARDFGHDAVRIAHQRGERRR